MKTPVISEALVKYVDEVCIKREKIIDELFEVYDKALAVEDKRKAIITAISETARVYNDNNTAESMSSRTALGVASDSIYDMLYQNLNN